MNKSKIKKKFKQIKKFKNNLIIFKNKKKPI